MVTIPLFQRHERYKTQQAKLETWLLENAWKVLRRTGHPKEELFENDISSLAEIIRDAKPKIAIPQDVHTLVANIIYDRSVANEIYQRFREERRLDDNDRHISFIQDLESVQASLLKLRPTATKAPAKARVKSSEVTNFFTLLKLEEPKSLPSNGSRQTPEASAYGQALQSPSRAVENPILALHICKVRCGFPKDDTFTISISSDCLLPKPGVNSLSYAKVVRKSW